jgi:hypothetical protein
MVMRALDIFHGSRFLGRKQGEKQFAPWIGTANGATF